jgi:hypothetical protein
MMDDIQLCENQIGGLEGKLRGLRANKELFVKAQGLEEEAEKTGKEIGDIGTKLQATKEELADLRLKKAAALSGTCEALSARMSEVLPSGKADLTISEDGAVWIGWQKPNGARVPYAGLSGGQRAPFDQALSFALLGEGEKILVLEAAELDPINLQAAINRLSRIPEDTQVIVNTYQMPAEVPKNWRTEVIK